ncbi:MAG TPA: hypothetical protein VFB76_13210 [Candidatus Angelobacter sp.]|nr:hypothetical protein [Candidatus Angelobacter sp.]
MPKTAINPALRNSGLCNLLLRNSGLCNLLLRNLWLCAVLLFIVPASLGAQQEAQPLPNATNEFVQQILSRIGPSTSVSIGFQNVSSLSPDNQQSLQNTILNAFHGANVRLVKPEQAQTEIQIAFSEDWQGYVWLATVKQGPNSQVVIKKIARMQTASSSRTPTLTIRKIPVWQQEAQILDFYQDNQNLLVLELGQLSIYANDSGQWRPRQTLGIPHQQPWPRDLRGKLEVHSGHVDVFLPGTRCSGSISPPALDCRESDDPWPVDPSLVAFFSPRRNFFSGLLAGQTAGASVAPFFSGVAWQNGDQRMWLFTGTDGRARLFQNDLATPIATYNGWGSTVAAVHSNCGSGWQLLASSPADTIHPDNVQAIEITGHEALPVSAPVDLSGDVEALWTAGNYNQVVNGVMHSQANGKYEAFTLTVICNQ